MGGSRVGTPEGVVEAATCLRWEREPGAPVWRGRGRGFSGHNYARIRLGSSGLVGREKPFLPEKSHAIPLGQFSICPKNVGIATVGFQSLNNVLGNCMRHLWGTMRVCRAFAGCSQGSSGAPRVPRGAPYFRGLAVDSRIVRTGLKVWSCSGCGEDLVDEVDALWCGATRVHPRQ